MFMIKKLEILNGVLDLEFNEYTYFYTLSVDSNTNALDFSYEVDDGALVDIRDNNLNSSENLVYLDVSKDDKVVTYTFLVYKDNLSSASSTNNLANSIEIKKTEDVSLIKVQALCISLFFIVIIIFSIMFGRKKRKRCIIDSNLLLEFQDNIESEKVLLKSASESIESNNKNKII